MSRQELHPEPSWFGGTDVVAEGVKPLTFGVVWFTVGAVIGPAIGCGLAWCRAPEAR